MGMSPSLPLHISPKAQALLTGTYGAIRIVGQDTNAPALMDLRTNVGAEPLYEGKNVIDVDGVEYTLVVDFDSNACAVTIRLEGEAP